MPISNEPPQKSSPAYAGRIKECPLCKHRAFTVTKSRLLFDPSDGSYVLQQLYGCNSCNSSYWQIWRLSECNNKENADAFPGDCLCGGCMKMNHLRMDEDSDKATEYYECGSCHTKATVVWAADNYQRAKGPYTSVYLEVHSREDYMLEGDKEVLIGKTDMKVYPNLPNNSVEKEED